MLFSLTTLRHSSGKLQAKVNADQIICARQVFLVLSSLLLLPPSPSSSNLSFSTPQLRHALRLRPFLSLCHPPVPSALDFESQTSSTIKKLSLPSLPQPSRLSNVEKRALSTFDHIDALARSARAAWDRVLKAEPEVARCIGSEEGWRAGVRDVMKSAIAVGICVAGLRKWVLTGCPNMGERGSCRVELPGVGYGVGPYHAWWIVPKVMVGDKAIS